MGHTTWGRFAVAVALLVAVASGGPSDRCQRWAERMVAAEPPPAAAPRAIPPELFAAFTLNGRVPVEYMYIDESGGGAGTETEYDAASMRAHVSAATRALAAPGARSAFAIRALVTDAVRDNRALFSGARVIVFGTVDPWVEALALAVGAASVTTIEYNKLVLADPRVTVHTPRELAQALLDGALEPFTIALSISSFDHDGLGRYGDSLAPDGDLDATAAVRCVLAPDGVLFLAVPLGADLLVFNMHRRYGPLRLARLLDGWRVTRRWGWNATRAVAPAPWRAPSYEPLFALMISASSSEDARKSACELAEMGEGKCKSASTSASASGPASGRDQGEL